MAPIDLGPSIVNGCNLTALLQSTHLGGATFDQALDLAIDPVSGEIYVTGVTQSVDFQEIDGGMGTSLSPRDWRPIWSVRYCIRCRTT